MYDISFSHKPDRVFVGISQQPYRIGVDLEKFDVNLNTKAFMKYAFSEIENIVLKSYCDGNSFSLVQGVVLFWSIKESFFKCLDYQFLPKAISIVNITNKGGVNIKYHNKIKMALKRKKLGVKDSIVKFDNEYIYSVTIMEKI